MATSAVSGPRRKYSTRDERSRAVEAWRRSGLRQGEFASCHAIPMATFRRWVRDAGGEPSLSVPPATPALVPVRIEATLPSPALDPLPGAFEIRLPSGIELRVPPRFERGALRDLLSELASCSR